MSGMKQCSKCRIEKPTIDFSKNRATKDGLAYYCKDCKSQRAKRYRRDYRDEISQWKKEYYKTNQGRKVKARANGKYNATIRGHLVQVFGGMKHRCNNSKCGHFKNYGGRGILNKFNSSEEFINYVVGELKVDPRGLQIDRPNNDGHYEKGNIRFVTAKVNANNRRKKACVAN